MTDWDSWAALRRKVAFLEKPDSYPEPTASVDVIETHMSWVFLTEEAVYKLKKPARLALVNLVTLESRKRNAEAELRWNQRLAPEVYLGVVPLSLDAEGRLMVGEGVRAVDWLVKMRRLSSRKTLDREIATGAVTPGAIERLAERLTDFYRDASKVAIGANEYRRRIRDEVRDVERELRELSPFPASRVERISSALSAFLGSRSALLDERVEQGRIVEGHGDLRPEHVFLLETPVVIDCVEFSRELRTVDPLDELSFLSLECDLLGGPSFLERILFETYARGTDDVLSEELIRFYKLFRAFARAKTTIWHLRDENLRSREKWIERAERYLMMAEKWLPGGSALGGGASVRPDGRQSLWEERRT